MADSQKHEQFLRIAHKRKNHVVECLHSLGNCSDPNYYDYELDELRPIFRAIIEKLAEVWWRMNCHSLYAFIPFRLSKEKELVVAGRRCRWDQMATKTEVLDLLAETGAMYTSLEPIRSQYNDLFVDDLCWRVPISTCSHAGCVLLAVQEGILYLPYNDLDSETYEQFDMDAVRLLTAEQIRKLADSMLLQVGELYIILADIIESLPITEPSEPTAGEELTK